MQVAQRPSNAGHTRGSSFFSSFRKQSSASNDSQQRTPSLNGHEDSPRQQPHIPQLAQQPSSSSSPSHSHSNPPPRPVQQVPEQPQQPVQLHPEIRSVVQLTAAHSHKIYFSGPLIRRIERDANGNKPAKDEGWTEVWAQLGGTTLSVWDMKQIREASQQGKEVPPAYINMTDAFVQVLGAISIPVPGNPEPQRHENVLTLNTAGSNLLIFACPSPNALISWASALRLSAWEKARLEEIYTAHLIRITLSARDIPTTLTNGKLEGWVRVRIAGQTDWKSLWMVVSAANDSQTDELGRVVSSGAGNNTGGRKRRMSNFFGKNDNQANGQESQKAHIAMYTSNKPKDKKKPLMTMSDVTQAFAVYPERPELITRSTLVKLEGMLGQEELAAGLRGREGWLLVMPQLEGNLSPAAEMLKWVIGFHDAFGLYGRPQAWTWDPRDVVSLMFAYPVGPHKDLLFLDREQAEKFDPREDRTSAVRARFLGLLATRMQELGPPVPDNQPPQSQLQQRPSSSGGPSSGRGPQLPPLSFDRTDQREDRHLLTPITERSSVYTHGRSMSGDAASVLGPRPSMQSGGATGGGGLETATIPEEPRTPPVGGDGDIDIDNSLGTKITDRALSASPPPGPEAAMRAGAPLPPVKDAPSHRSADSRSSSFVASVSASGSRMGPTSTGRTSLDRDRDGVSVGRLGSPPLNAPTSKPNSILSSGGGDYNASNNKPQTPNSLSSPHSVGSPHSPPPPQTPERPVSILTSPYSPAPSSNRPLMDGGGISRNSSATASISMANSINNSTSNVRDSDSEFSNEAGALFYMQQQHNLNSGGFSFSAGRMPTTIAETDRDGDDDSSAEFPAHNTTHSLANNTTTSSSPGNMSPSPSNKGVGNSSPVVRQGTPMAFVERSVDRGRSSFDSAVSGEKLSGAPSISGNRAVPSPPPSASASFTPSSPNPSRPGVTVLGRKPSGARAPHQSINGPGRMNLPTGASLADQTQFSSSPSSIQQFSQQQQQQYHRQQQQSGRPSQLSEQLEEDEDEEEDSMMSGPMATAPRVVSPTTKLPPAETPASPSDDSNLDVLAALSYLDVADATEQPLGAENKNVPQTEPLKPARSPPISSHVPAPVKAAEVKSTFSSNKAAERKAKAQAQQAAAAAAASRPGRMGNQKRKMRTTRAGEGAWSSDEEDEDEEDEEEDEDNEEVDSDVDQSARAPSGSGANSSNNSVRPPPPQGQFGQGPPFGAGEYGGDGQGHLRPPRTLPQVPPGRLYDSEDYMQMQAPAARQPRPIDPYSQMARNTYYDDGTPIRTQAEHAQPTAPRHQQTMWNSVLDPHHSPGQPPDVNSSRNNDKFVQLDESATMTKAFTPQGLLSAGIHDKQGRSAKRQEELARESGASLINVPNKPPPPQTGLLGAITAHERERKREGGVGAALTEREREKRVAEERQRRFDEAQRQQLDQMQQTGSMYGMNPMMMNMGMNPMMMNPMMTGGMNPMMTGSMNPMMSGYGMPGFSPQQMFAAQQAAAQAYQQAMMAYSSAGSQAGGDAPGSPPLNPMMTGGMNMMSPMSMGMGFDPRMSMMGYGAMGGMGMGGMNPMGMSMTGMSQFDPRFPPTPSPMNELPSPGLTPNTNTNSPVRRGSPLAGADVTNRGSRPTSPKPAVS